MKSWKWIISHLDEFALNIAEKILTRLFPILSQIDERYSDLELAAVRVKDKATVLKDLIQRAEEVTTATDGK